MSSSTEGSRSSPHEKPDRAVLGVQNEGPHCSATLAMAQFMVVLDFTIVNVALPSIGHGLHVAPTTLQWLVSAYAVTFGGFLLLGGRLADVFGQAVPGRPLHLRPGQHFRRPGGRAEAVDRLESRSGARRLDAGPGGAFPARHELAGRRSAQPRSWCVRGGGLGRVWLLRVP